MEFKKNPYVNINVHEGYLQMDIYYVMVEATPKLSTPESKEFGGAYINCWVNAAAKNHALSIVKGYIDKENWMYVKTKDIFIAQRHLYVNEPDSLECYDEACKNGLSAIFYTWPIG